MFAALGRSRTKCSRLRPIDHAPTTVYPGTLSLWVYEMIASKQRFVVEQPRLL